MESESLGKQLAALRCEVCVIAPEERRVRNRRAFFGILGGLLGGGIAIVFGARALGASDAQSRQAGRIEQLPHELRMAATGPTERLLATRWMLMQEFQSGNRDPVLLVGITRLVQIATNPAYPEAEGLRTYILDLDATALAPLVATLREQIKLGR